MDAIKREICCLINNLREILLILWCTRMILSNIRTIVLNGKDEKQSWLLTESNRVENDIEL